MGKFVDPDEVKFVDPDSFVDPDEEPQARPVTGFAATLRDPRRQIEMMQKGEGVGGLASLARIAAGGKTQEQIQQERAKTFGVLRTPRQQEIDRQLQAYEGDVSPAGIQAQGKLVEEWKQEEKQRTAKPEPASLGDIGQAILDNPKEVAAEFVNAIAEDPEFLLTPAGWETLGAKVASVAIKYGPKAAKVGKALGGATGAALTGAAIQAPVSTAQEAQRGGKFDVGRVVKETAMTAAVSPLVVGAGKGLASLAKGARKLPAKQPTEAHRGVGAEAAVTPQTKLGAVMDAAGEKAGTAGAKVARLGRGIADVTGGKSITPVRRLGEGSATAKKLANALEPEETPTKAVGAGYFERISRQVGSRITHLEDALDPIRRFGKVTKANNNDLVRALRGEKVTGPAAKSAMQIRKILDDTRAYGREAGLDIGYVKDYFTRVYKFKALRGEKLGGEFERVLVKRGIDATKADDILRHIIDTEGTLDAPGSVGKKPMAQFGAKVRARRDPNTEMQRTLAKIPDKELAPFLEDNAHSVLTKYIENIVHRAEWARVFGKGGGKLDGMLLKMRTEAARSGRKMVQSDVDRIVDLANALQKTYQPFQSRGFATANKMVVAYQYLRTLTLATISSLSEPFVVFLRANPSAGIRAAFKSLDHVARQTARIISKKVPKAQVTRAAEEAGLALDSALTERLTAAFGGESTKFTAAFFKLNFLHQFTKFNRVFGNEAGKLMAKGHIKALAKGKGGARYARKMERELVELGIDPIEGIAWFRRGAKESDPFHEKIINAGIRFTNEVVMAPRATVRPMWHSNPHLHTVSQLKGFQTVFGNTVVKRVLREVTQRGVIEGTQNAVKFSFVASLMVMTAMMGNELRELIQYGPEGNPKKKNQTLGQRVRDAVDRAGFTGAFQFGLDAMYAHRFGSPAIANLAGPTISQLNELIEGLGAASEGKPRKLARAAVTAVPLVNVIPGIRKKITDAIAPRERR